MAKKYVYFYGGGKKMTDGDRSMRQLLGGKGANLAEMSNAGVPVPPGFTISTEACHHYEEHGSYPKEMMQQVKQRIGQTRKTGRQETGACEKSVAGFCSFGCRPIDAGHDGHGSEPRHERQIGSWLHQDDRQRASRLGLLPTLHRHVW